MKKLYLSFVLTLIISINNVDAQDNFSLGVRLGDPSGLTLKKYFGGKALELSIGRSRFFTRDRWYGDRFSHWRDDYYKTYAYRRYKDIQFVDYRVSTPIGIQLHYLIQKDIKGIDALQLYIGFGGQIRHQSYYYNYRYKLEGDDKNWRYEAGERVSDIDFGLDGVIGLEYKFKEVPISLFCDFTLFMEVFDNPFVFWGQGGIGARYNF